MPICEFSGEETQTLVEVEIEGVRMKVAPKYAKFGTRVEQHAPARRARRAPRRASVERTDTVKRDAPKLLRDAFHAIDTDEEAIAKRLGLKESQFKAYLRGDHPIPVEDARSLGRFFGIELIETVEQPAEETTSAYRSHESGGLTLGDLLKGAKR